jgi:DNA-binding NtrC family response regulator
LTAYDWPGNVRELRNAVERALIFEDGLLLSADYMALPGAEPPQAGGAGAPAEDLSLPEMETRLIRKALELSGGNVTKAADRLGISRDALRYRLKSSRGGGREDGR